MEDCLICTRIKMIKEDCNKYYVKELETGYVVIGDHQYFKGYTLFLCKEHRSELHELDNEFKEKFLVEMSRVAEAVHRAFKPIKLNYELLGNGDSHMHWHIFPRSEKELNPTHPVWWTPRDQMFSKNVKPNDQELAILKSVLLSELDNLIE